MRACHSHQPEPSGAAIGVKVPAVHEVVAQLQGFADACQPPLGSRGADHLSHTHPLSWSKSAQKHIVTLVNLGFSSLYKEDRNVSPEEEGC